ncbi:hypothetical protein [Chitinophaga flava]|uniref:Uncharacterized protein n=1 Tax=Chitinophaga flava TaxID=2259036 RepID=A0A365XW03_9BACT|nr:hypothetical protein [Chitinophaga flava]RBL90268.1 hypothetical protein DF182_27780 [Chitinophaga flava]
MRIIYLALATVVFMSCAQTKRELPAIRPYVFNDSGLRVITTVINEKAGTVSMLYGNNAAMNFHAQHATVNSPKELYKFVTYREQDNQYWYGSYINGELLSVETVDMAPLSQGEPPHYSIQQYNGSPATDYNAATRTAFIQTLQPAWYPCDPY